MLTFGTISFALAFSVHGNVVSHVGLVTNGSLLYGGVQIFTPFVQSRDRRCRKLLSYAVRVLRKIPNLTRKDATCLRVTLLSAIAVINWPTAALYCSSCEDPGYIRILGLGWLLKVSGCVGNHRWVFVRLRIYSRGFRTWDLGFSPSEKVSDRPSVRGGNTHHCTSKQPAARS